MINRFLYETGHENVLVVFEKLRIRWKFLKYLGLVLKGIY